MGCKRSRVQIPAARPNTSKTFGHQTCPHPRSGIQTGAEGQVPRSRSSKQSVPQGRRALPYSESSKLPRSTLKWPARQNRGADVAVPAWEHRVSTPGHERRTAKPGGIALDGDGQNTMPTLLLTLPVPGVECCLPYSFPPPSIAFQPGWCWLRALRCGVMRRLPQPSGPSVEVGRPILRSPNISCRK